MVNNWLEDYKNFLYIKNAYLKEKKDRFTYMEKLNYITDFKKILRKERKHFFDWLMERQEYDLIKNNIIDIFENVRPFDNILVLCNGIVPEIEQKYIENFKDIIKIHNVNVAVLLLHLWMNVTGDNYIKLQELVYENFEYIMENLHYDNVEEFLIVTQKLNSTKINNKVKNNYLKFVNKAEEWECLRILERCNKIGKIDEEDLQKDFKEILKKFFENNKEIVESEDLLEAVELLIKQLAQKQNVKLKDINYYFGGGYYSSCLKIGEYVLKLGRLRKTSKIPYHPRILQPLIRRPIPYRQETNKNVTDDIIYFLEISECVDKNWTEGLTKEQIVEEMYKIYKEMRKDGIICGDIKPENIGRLLRPNKVNYEEDGEQLNVNDEGVGFTNVPKRKKILPKGELVIIDTDYIYKEENNFTIQSKYSEDFENRYQKEDKNRNLFDYIREI